MPHHRTAFAASRTWRVARSARSLVCATDRIASAMVATPPAAVCMLPDISLVTADCSSTAAAIVAETGPRLSFSEITSSRPAPAAAVFFVRVTEGCTARV